MSDKPKRNPENAFQPIGDEGGLVVVPEDSKVQVLNPVASTIFSMLDGEHSHEDIVRAIVEEYEVSEETARADLQSFLEELRGQELLADGKKEAANE